jgi:hypothetical protein
MQCPNDPDCWESARVAISIRLQRRGGYWVMMTKYFIHIGLVVAFSLSVGCAGNKPLLGESKLEKNWGRSYESMKYNQILNPEAEKNLEPVIGLEGEAAKNSVEKYRNTFKGKGDKATYNFSLGTISGIGTK